MGLFRDKDGKKLLTFLLLMGVTGIVFNYLIIRNGGNIEENLLYAVILIFSPAVLSLLVNFSFEKNLRGFGWKWQHTKWHLMSYAIPFLYIVGTYGFVILLGGAKLDFEKVKELGPFGILMIPTFGLTGAVIPVLGEEIGWRGFLLNTLYKKMSFTKANLITGVVWALFHYPLLILGNYNNGATPAWYAFLFFTIALMGANTMINWLYIQSGSLWTAVIFHTVHNSLLNDLNPLLENTNITPYLLTEFGAVLAITIMIISLFFVQQQEKLPSACTGFKMIK